jgi:MFS family permease
MNFRKVNNITGWVVFAVASLVYILTAEKSGSFWDCGEFVASAYKVQMPHPPGAPLFVLLGRFFIILFGDNPADAAKAVNIMSAFASSFTILFLFWTITHLARKLVVGSIADPNDQQTLTIMGAGVVGALAYTFSDSFWFSAVEGEVYALSSFFTALVFWAMLKWERADDLAGNDRVLKNRADRWIVFLFFMMGLSIGVHLLNLLTIPAIVMIYYYKRYNYSQKGAIWAFIIGCVITGVVQVAVIQWTVKFAGKFDIFFVNDFHFPFFSGFVFFFILLGVLIWLGLKVAVKRHWSFLRLGLWCFIFMMLGYSTYVTTLERSNANPAIDMNNVDNPMSLVYYLGREQYGSQPILYGPHFMADYKVDENGYVALDSSDMKYTKGKDGYIPIGREQEPLYEDDDYMLFPRVWDRSNDQYHVDFYGEWLNLPQVQDPRTGQKKYEAPSYADNINWFVTYQMGFMYWRYFMWNFAGKQNDIQGFGNKRDGNWISGISFIDNARLGDQTKMPASIKNNKAHNSLYLLPFILGIIGCVYQFLKNRRDWIITFLLFFFTGLAIVIYLNQPGNQPRERDYAYVGSFYAFAIWIGLAVVGLVRLAREKEDRQALVNTITFGAAAAFLIALLSNTTTTFGGAFISSLLAAILFALVTGILFYIVKAVSKNENSRMATLVAFALCLIAPVIMASQEWNDHDRSKKTLAPDIARDYLESCAPNAILFTFGDNDTYPLWYAQEVEGVRPDIRIINYSLLGIDWYANQLRYKVNQSDPIDIIWTPEQIEGHKREYIRYQEDTRVSKESFYPLYDVMKNVLGQGDNANTFPVKRFMVPVDTSFVRKSGIANAADSVFSQMLFEIPEGRNDLTRADLVILNILAANNWKRPIYFTSPFGELGFGQYLRKDGLSYRLVPVKNVYPQQNWVTDQALREAHLGGTSIRDNNSDVMYKNMMEKFRFGGANTPGVYFDEENRRHLLSVRATYAEAAGNLADKNRKQEALNLLNKEEAGIDPANLPYAMASRYNSHNQNTLILMEAAYKAGNRQLADKLSTAIRNDLESQKKYYDYLRTEKEDFFQSVSTEAQINDIMMQVFERVNKYYTQNQTPVEHPEAVEKAADSTRKK